MKIPDTSNVQISEVRYYSNVEGVCKPNKSSINSTLSMDNLEDRDL